jgi:hypothetical protein
MKKILSTLFFLFCAVGAWAQSNPTTDRPIQQCISENKDKVELLKSDFSVGHWLYKLMEACDKLNETDGKKGGQYVVRLLEMEKELDDLIALADVCPALQKAKPKMEEMKKIFTEREKVENFKKTEEKKDNSGNMFEDDKEITTMSLPRGAATKIKAKAKEVRKLI